MVARQTAVSEPVFCKSSDPSFWTRWLATQLVVLDWPRSALSVRFNACIGLGVIGC